MQHISQPTTLLSGAWKFVLRGLHFGTLRTHPRFPTVKFPRGINSGQDSKPLAICYFLYLCRPRWFPSHLRPNKLMREVLENERKQTTTFQFIFRSSLKNIIAVVLFFNGKPTTATKPTKTNYCNSTCQHQDPCAWASRFRDL